uniref:Odorant receptor n=1 Tax=Bactrocera minax TaxID=104690 RepID=A0A3G2LEJ7_9MUSC|nr:odorant receptor 63a1-1 [Bactrocera minax]
MMMENAEEIYKRNYNYIKVLIRVSFSLGVNLTAPSKIKDALKLISVILSVTSLLSMYGHCCYLMRHLDRMPLIAEAVFTALQILMAAIKLIYFFFTHRTFYRLLDQTLTHEIIRKMEILQQDFPINRQLKKEIDDIMNAVWRNIRRILLFYFFCCVGIIANYFFTALFQNLYHHLKQTPNYEFILPVPSQYPFWEKKGMAFPYYHLQMYVTGSALYVSGLGAVSFEGVFMVLCQHAVGLVKVHNLLVLRATSAQIPVERRLEYLRYTIFNYQRINKYMHEIQTIFRHISLSQFILSLIVIGFVLFEINYGLGSNIIIFIRLIMYISASITQITIYCYHGQALTTVNEKIPLAYYNCNWYGENKTFKQLIMMMIMRTNKEFYLEVSWFTLMNLATLISLIKASVSYYLLLQHFQEN